MMQHFHITRTILSRGALSLSLSLAFISLISACDEPAKPAAKAEKPKLGEAATAAALVPKPAPVEEKKVEEQKPIECADGPNVDFHDKALEKEVRKKLEKPDGDIKKSELRKVRSINRAKGEPVDYLDPCVFPHLTEVRDVFLGRGSLTDLTPLAALKHLSALRAADNQVSDISVLGKFAELDRLDLGRTQVKDLKPLSTLTKLTELQLDGTPLEDVSPLATLTKLTRLSLRGTQVKDISMLKDLKDLKQIDIANAPVDNPLVLNRPGLKVILQ